MDIEEVDVHIDADGQVRIEVRGVKGGGCRDITAPLETALGGDVVSREMTAEAAENVTVDSEQHLQAGLD